MKRETLYKLFSSIPTLETERLILRKISLDDTDDMYEYSKDPDVSRYLTWSPHEDKGYTFEYIKYLQGRYKAGDIFDWAMIYKENGKMIGTGGFARIDCPNDCGEIGYVINPKYHRLGIATEFLGRIIKFGFENLALNRIECRFMPDNIASRKVMEKNGMVFEGINRESALIKGMYRDIGICAILKEDFYKNT